MGKFHFKLYVLCCAIANLVVRICIHTKDSSDMDYTSEEFDWEQIKKTDKLTSEMCSILHGCGEYGQLLHVHNCSN
jgi:hypothetical protein